MKRCFAAALAALLLLTLTACAPSAPEQTQAEPPVTEEPEVSVPDPEPTPEELAAQEIEDLMSSMTLEEKVGQLFFVRCPADSAAEDVAAYHLGAISSLAGIFRTRPPTTWSRPFGLTSPPPRRIPASRC